jgi:tetratricopeptide (TPR) repeat protein
MILSGAFAVLLVAAHAAEPPKNSSAIQHYYDEALADYARGDYRAAIIKWTAIIKEDPDQRSAPAMIVDARRKIERLTAKRRRSAFDAVAAGQYRKAFLELEALLDQDPNDPQLQTLQRRLQTVMKTAPHLSMKTKASRAAILGLKGYLTLPPDLKLAFDGLRYACELEPAEATYQALLDQVLVDFPGLAASDAITPGLKLLEYKHKVALHQIYDAKYHLAVVTLDEILALEPEDLLALKRKGSAYYSLGRLNEAQEAWSSAQRLAPKDATLQKFLEKVRRAKLKKYKKDAATP